MSKNFILIFVLSGILYPLTAQENLICFHRDHRWAPRERIIDMHHLKLEIEPDAAKGLVRGKATLVFTPLFRPVDSIWLDAIRFDFSDVRLQGQKVNFLNLDSGLVIYTGNISPGQMCTLEIQYSAYPSKGMYFVGWDDPTGKARKQIWTQGQGTDHRHWIPYYDEQHDKLTTEVIIFFDRNFRAISNGRLLAVDTLRDKIRWHYLQDKPHSGYLIMVAIGEYLPMRSTLSLNGRTIEFEEFIYPDVAYAGESTYRHSLMFMQKFEEILKIPYPWPGPYRNVPVVDFIYGAMENTGAVIFSEMFISDTNTESYRNYHLVNAHEMAHQWFGNLITAWSARHHWLHESFATYFDLLSSQWTDGDFAFSAKVRQAISRVYMQEISNNLPLAHSEAGTARHYQKGGVVLHMLRQLVGDKAFYEALRVFLDRYQFKNVHSEDLLYTFHEVTGRDLQWYWDQWIYGSGIPNVRLSWNEVTEKNSKGLRLVFEQENAYSSEASKVFRLKFNVEVKTSRNTYILPVEISSKSDTFFLPVSVDEKILMVNPDPGKLQLINWIRIDDPDRNIPKMASHPYDRLFAYRLNKSSFQISDLDLVKNERDVFALTQWIDAFGANVMRPEVWNFFSSMNDERIHLSIIRFTDIPFWKNRSENELIRFAQSGHPLLRAAAYSRLINARPDMLSEYQQRFRVDQSFITQNERLMMAIAEADLLKNKQSLDAVAEFATTQYMASVRSLAIEYLKRQEYVDESFIRMCVHALGHYDRNLPGLAASYLNTIRDKRMKKIIDRELKKYKPLWPEWKFTKAQKLLEIS